MKIAINKAHFPVTVLGPGQRIGIWLQGCSIHCKNCVSQDTWARDPGRETTVARLMSWCREIQATAEKIDGITISGGEPFDQPRALAALLEALDAWRGSLGSDFDILCYSGYPYATLQQRHPAILQRLDALIPEPYADALPMTQIWRGSSNQLLVPLSPRGRAVYAEHINRAAATGKRMQTCVDGDRVWYIGIPARGDMDAMARQCAEQGIHFDQVSWKG